MPSESEHLAQARANLGLADELQVGTWATRQWACTIYFYVAVHSVEAAVAGPGRFQVPSLDRASRHDWRQAWMALNAVPELVRGFRTLRTTSNRTRYELFRPSVADVQRCSSAAHDILRRAEAHQLAH